MKAPQGEITGVVQLINCKRDARPNADPSSAADVVMPFPDQCRPMLRSLLHYHSGVRVFRTRQMLLDVQALTDSSAAA